MSIFRKKKTGATIEDARSLIELHEKGIINDTVLLSLLRRSTIFYSTPYGDHEDGSSRLFALPASDNTGYLPAFSSIEKLKEFYDGAGRKAYLIMDGTTLSFLEMINETNNDLPVKMGAVIDPGYYGVTINADMLNEAILMMNPK
jgi:hypothetical protein